MFNGLRLPELLVIAAIVLLLFGAKRLPDAARVLGRYLRIFKAETKGLADDSSTSAASAAEAPSVTPPAAPEGDRPQG